MTKEKNIIAPIAGIMVALTALNIGVSYLINKTALQNNNTNLKPIIEEAIRENNIKIYGSQENFEKFSFVTKTQHDMMPKLEDLKHQVEQMKKMTGGNQDGNEGMIEQHQDAETSKLTKEDLVANTPVYGKKDAKYSIYEFSDFECPYCKGFHNSGVAKEAVDKNKDSLNYIKRNFQFHQGAPMKAEASLCAIDQKGDEGYFSMINSIFNGSLREGKEEILAMAEKNGLDKAKLDECINSGKYKNALEKDYNLGAGKMGVTGTPSVFVVNNETGEFKRLNGRSVSAIEELMKSL